ncbi:unnamed protein product [Rhodiola kirilowii]
MSESERGLMATRENSSPGKQQPMMHNSIDMSLTFPEGAEYKQLAVGSPPYAYQSPGNGSGEASSMAQHGMINMNMVGSSGEVKVKKKKRGRPRKYGLDGNMSLSLDSAAHASAGRVFSPPPSGGSMSLSSERRGRGRPPGPGRKQQVGALGSTGSKFTTHVILVGAKEDISSKIMSFSQHGPRAVCILSANGIISNVTLGQPASSGTISYEGHFEILSLSGSFLLMENDGQRRRSGGLSVSLAGSDGRILGGRVAGVLVAASPVQVVVGSFVAESYKEAKVSYPTEPMPAPPNLTPATAATGSSSPSRGTMSESSGGPASPHNQSHNSSNPQVMPWK